MIIERDNSKNRVETGTVQFGDDWPGVFIRGDNAGWYAHILGSFLDDLKNDPNYKERYVDIIQLEGLKNILQGCIVK